MTEIYDACRWFNQYLGALGALCVMWRLVPLVLDRPRWKVAAARHRILVFCVLAGYALISALGAAHYDGTTVQAQWYSAAFTGLHLATVSLCLWWPHPVRLSTGEDS